MKAAPTKRSPWVYVGLFLMIGALLIFSIAPLVTSILQQSRIENSGVKIRSLDIPNMDTLNLGIYGTIAQHERELTSTRTKNALAELKKIGKVLGTPANLTNDAKLKGQIAIKRNARENDRNRQAKAVITACLSKGMTLRQTADYLNELNFRTRYGKSFMATSVMRLHKNNISK
jgi:hypothetical protein